MNRAAAFLLVLLLGVSNPLAHAQQNEHLSILLSWENVNRDGVTDDEQSDAIDTIASFVDAARTGTVITFLASSVGKTPRGAMKTIASMQISEAVANGTAAMASGRNLLATSDRDKTGVDAALKLLQDPANEHNLKTRITRSIEQRISAGGRRTSRGLKGFEGRASPPRLARILVTKESVLGATRIQPRPRQADPNRHIIMGATKGSSATFDGNSKRFNPRYFAKGSQAQQKIHSTSNSLWDMDRINQLSANLDGNLDLPNIYTQEPPEPSVIYLFDTYPLASHVEFGGRLSVIHNGHEDTDGNQACDAHGTHVAAKMIGSTMGINPQGKVYALSVLNCEGWGYNTDIILGLAVAHQHCTEAGGRSARSVSLNLSLGGPGDPQSATSAGMALMFKEIYEDCDANIVVAAGNSAMDAAWFIPAGFTGPDQGNPITVGASNIADEFAYFSNYGSRLDINAPGVNILSADICANDCYATMSGTSASAPIVTAIMSLYHTQRPSNFDLLYPGKQFADNASNKLKSEANRVVKKVPNTSTTVRLAFISGAPIPTNELLSPVAPATTPPSWVRLNSANQRKNTPAVITLIAVAFLALATFLL